MPSEAATNLHLVRSMINAGMDVCRVNCAHDSPEAWKKMIQHVRQASEELRQPCRILIDLAGPKLRTGRIASTGRVVRCRPVRDMRGDMIHPARVWITPAGNPRAPDVEADAIIPLEGDVLAQAEPGTILQVRDVREKKRSLRVIAKIDGSCWAEAEDTTYLEVGTIVRIDRTGQPSVLRKIIGLYLESAPALLQRLREAVAAGDSEALRQAAHSFKSSSANLGATQLAAHCKELEHRGRERNLEDVAALLRAVESHYVRAREALIVAMEQE